MTQFLLSMRFVLAASLVLAATLASAQAPGTDVAGAADHPLVKRFAGSWLIGARGADWDAAAVPAGPELDKADERKFEELVQLEGKVTQRLYIAPRGKSSLEVWRNYEQALAAAGLKKRFVCETDCANLYFAWAAQLEPAKGFTWSKGDLMTPDGGSRYSLQSALQFDQGRMLVGTLGAPGREATVLLYNCLAANAVTGLVATYIQIIEPKSMTTGQVSVDAGALGKGLATDGRVTLAGLFFDTGKSEIKSESKSQLDEMAKLMRAQPALKVFIVGHTDNVGSFDANVALSQARAQAVVSALAAAPLGIDAKRMVAKGLANIAPAASNGSDEGRARNRRVELVAQ